MHQTHDNRLRLCYTGHVPMPFAHKTTHFCRSSKTRVVWPPLLVTQMIVPQIIKSLKWELFRLHFRDVGNEGTTPAKLNAPQ